MKFEVNIDKKYFFILLGAILILAGAIYGYAQDGSAPNPGHDWSEIGNVPAGLDDGDADTFAEISGVQAEISSGLTACSGSNKAIKTINPTTGAVTCETDDVGGSSPSGLVLGGGYTYSFGSSCYAWGVAFCGGAWGTELACSTGTTRHRISPPGGSDAEYLCITN